MAALAKEKSCEALGPSMDDGSEPDVSATHDWPFPKSKEPHRAEVISMLENHREIHIPDPAPQVLHIRELDDRRFSSNRGGATIAYNVDGNGRLWAAVALNRGNFNKKIQRRNALIKLENGVSKQVDCFHVETISSCLRRWFDETYKMGW